MEISKWMLILCIISKIISIKANVIVFRVATLPPMPPYIDYDMENGRMLGVLQEYGEIIQRLLKSNLSFVFASSPGSIAYGESYDGMIGLIQRDEADVGVNLVPLNSPYEPGVFGPVIHPFEGIMITMVEPNQEKIVDVTVASKTSFDGYFWILFFIYCYLFLTIIWIRSLCFNDGSSPTDIVWYMTRIILGNGDLYSRHTSTRVLYFLYIIFIYFIIIIFLSLFASSLIVKPEPEFVDRFIDIPNKRLQPYFIKGLPYWNQFSEAKSGPYKEVWDVCRKIGRDKCLLGDGDTMRNAEDFLGGGKFALIVPSILLRLGYPIFKARNLNRKYHIASEQMESTSYASLYSKNITTEKRRILDKAFLTAFESGLNQKVLRDIFDETGKLVANFLELNVLARHSVDYEEINQIEKSDGTEWRKIKMENLATIFNILLISFMIGFMILIVELIIRFFQ